MNFKMMGRLVGWILLAEAIFMVPAAAICLFDGDLQTMWSTLATVAVTATVAATLFFSCKNATRRFYAREGLVCVGLGWLALSLFGSLPFWFSGAIPSFVDAFFEIVSGFTTTGASILADVESMSRGLLYWRSFSHWLGGMGVLVFILAVLPASGGNDGSSVHLLRAESPGPSVDKLVSHMRQTAMILYLIYIALTVLCFVFLLCGGMSVFESVCTALGTAGTGGFGIKNDSMTSHSPYIQNVCTVFMLLFSVNFSCFYLILLRKIRPVLRDEELRTFLLIVAAAIGLIVWDLRSTYGSFGETLRHAAFQVASIVSTTGFATADFNLWPPFSKAILLMLMVVGACAGSTGGGMKCSRVLILLKGLHRNVRRTIHPQNVEVVRISGRVVNERVVQNATAFLAAYVLIFILSFVLISLDEFSVTTNLSAVLATLNNVGPGLDAVGPTCNYSGFSALSKLVLCFDMLAGRLEIFPVLALLSHSTWSRR